ncbi:DNA replication protein DnaC [Thalassobacillus cyri]|uniref:DNA replication protein DnaC n=2 Tax=Thalassobacillus cyri TaxID=571932 RepID=A0A1H4BYI4_9BACI|nr:DNA replication protein DnaC [Thalassobacillus cyri]
MQMSCENSKQKSQPGDEEQYECQDCKDSGKIVVRHFLKNENGQPLIHPNGSPKYKDIAQQCYCWEKRMLKKRFQNALIPDEFQEARLTTYRQDSEVQQTLFQATKEYLQSFDSIIHDRSEHNSLGFIAVVGESRIRSLDGSARAETKRKHNNFGLGKTHLQMAAAKWILNKARIRIPGDKYRPERTRGCSVLCVSDASFMDELSQAKRMNDEGKQLKDMLHSATTVDVLVWDDLGKSKWSETKEGLYYQIINERYRHKRPILFSSNEDKATLSEKIGYAASSRLLGMCGERLYEVEGEDYRLNKGEHHHV